MSNVSLSINGQTVTAEIEPRLHLADFLREHRLLTGTHLGCEHGVCGACTVLIDEEPSRACIAFAAACEGKTIRTIEGLEDDPLIAALREAFSAEHALQCGYCTPGMLVTARDIAIRLPDADTDRIRLELAGNLCRCTGYAGIVRAISRVLSSPVPRPSAERQALPTIAFGPVAASSPQTAQPIAPLVGTDNNRLSQTLRIRAPADAVWHAVRDPALIAGCVPGARLTDISDGRVAGEMVASLGPIQARFAGSATVTYQPENRSGRIVGEGTDRAGGSRLSAEARFAVAEDGPHASTIALDIDYALRGPLAQFSRGPIVRVFAAEIANSVARSLEQTLRGQPAAPPAPLNPAMVMLRGIWRRILGMLPGRDA